MKLCPIRCASLNMACEAFSFIMIDMNVKSPGKGKLGLSYDDFTFGFIKNKNDILQDSDCK